jgi:hypothetical protein
MQRMVNKQRKFGRSCTRCNLYFATNDKTDYLCHWCQWVETGEMKDGVFAMDDFIEL